MLSEKAGIGPVENGSVTSRQQVAESISGKRPLVVGFALTRKKVASFLRPELIAQAR